MTKKSTKEKVQKKINNKIISIKKKLNAQEGTEKLEYVIFVQISLNVDWISIFTMLNKLMKVIYTL